MKRLKGEKGSRTTVGKKRRVGNCEASWGGSAGLQEREAEGGPGSI